MKNNILFSKRGQLAPASPIRKLAPLADCAKTNNVNIFHLNIGQPDLPVPLDVTTALKSYSKLTHLPYTSSQGYPDLLSAWQKYLAGVNIKIDLSDIVITYGASEALVLVMAAICDPNDEILVFEPFYANYRGFANLVSVKVVPIALDKDNNYHLPSDEEIEAAITSKTKAIFFTNPNNPTGTVFRADELGRVLDIAKKNNLFIVSDETYFGLTFDDNHSTSFLHIAKGPDLERIAIIDSLSKRLNVCGARVGAVISKNSELMSIMNRFAQERLSVGTLDQMITAKALINSLTYVPKIAAEYQKRRDAFVGTLNKELDINIQYPEGAFYAMVPLPFSDADNFARWLLTDFREDNETVMVAPGSGFYASSNKGADEIRVAYVLNVPELIKAAKLLATAIQTYQKVAST